MPQYGSLSRDQSSRMWLGCTQEAQKALGAICLLSKLLEGKHHDNIDENWIDKACPTGLVELWQQNDAPNNKMRRMSEDGGYRATLTASFPDQAQYVRLVLPGLTALTVKAPFFFFFLSSLVYKHSYLLINVSLKSHYSKYRLTLCTGQRVGCREGGEGEWRGTPRKNTLKKPNIAFPSTTKAFNKPWWSPPFNQRVS